VSVWENEPNVHLALPPHLVLLHAYMENNLEQLIQLLEPLEIRVEKG
jgi:hypothetical protein